MRPICALTIADLPLDAFYKSGKQILFSAEANCFVKVHPCSAYRKHDGPFQYPNTGFIIGYAGAVARMFDESMQIRDQWLLKVSILVRHSAHSPYSSHASSSLHSLKACAPPALSGKGHPPPFFCGDCTRELRCGDMIGYGAY